MKLRGSDLRGQAANPGNRISIQGRVEAEHRVELAKVNLEPASELRNLNVFVQITGFSSFCLQTATEPGGGIVVG